MAFSLSSLSKSLSSLLPQQPPPNSPSLRSPPPTLQLPRKSSGFAPLISILDPKPTSSSTCLSSSLTTADEIAAITCPSFAYANTLFFKSGCYNVQVVVEENEPEERLLARFRRAVFKAGILQECRRRRFFENSQDKRKRKKREASKRNRKRRPQPKVSAQAKKETPKKKVDDEDDNWELPEGNLPY
ncbi:30S ribosomal protein S21, chloroplastic-like [Durio zibethinus]|uniref:30S ribosomal protein S21, chloroplastic-like n=1 Tax=Durio zibethinus TaxID=66656 RepID=A0A6P5Y7V9_DURZI|nr:30S ribosomal protein S21, chloroplastic-like [Durio zibethinus]XP_022736530.1 30S ribosomal protein S21, chloroplastic-like [Durio zibethinus]XP_022736533.1 30S ribosomal protein S21, chloroplastic-like [Durio zibethinus]XP_022736534.1 30S ribosomal protein S21, chloroplastic-like [Durio zibethinus]XP_022736535.1 30S ribosomal protein S21, chloroplastic-like [Durio zibethinus]XP_022736536.1 30S ribosomal protein S21, chloroplastic-like [Durio zibethinus]